MDELQFKELDQPFPHTSNAVALSQLTHVGRQVGCGRSRQEVSSSGLGWPGRPGRSSFTLERF